MVVNKNMNKKLRRNVPRPSRQQKLVYSVRYNHNNQTHQVNNYIHILTNTLQEAETPHLHGGKQ